MAKNFRIEVEKVGHGYLIMVSSNVLPTKPLFYQRIVPELTEENLTIVYYEALSTWEYDYGIGCQDHPDALTKAELLVDMQLHDLVGPNWVKVNPVKERSVREREQNLPEVHDWYLEALKDIDLSRFRSYDRKFFEDHVWFPRKENVPPLSALVLSRYSLFNYTSKDHEGKIVVASTSNLRPYKVPSLIRKYAKPVHVGVEDVFLRRCLVNGVSILASVMDVTKFFGTVNFTYSSLDLARTRFPGDSSSGLRCGRGSSQIVDGIKVVARVNGKKREQAPYAFTVVANYANQITKGMQPLYPETLCKISFKYEIVDAMWAFGQARLDKYAKCREFFIPHFADFLICNMVFGFRMLVERGNTICIGFKWWGGGAFQIATEMGYGRPGIHYHSGDIKGQDYTTPQYMLNLFIASTLAYIDPQSPDYELYSYMLRQCGDHLVAKLVNFTGSMWRWIVGTMPSGHYTTSHCNSWILAVYWWSYVYGVHVRNPRAQILMRVNNEWKVSKQYFIRFKVYGDNHVVSLSDNVRKYISYLDFIKYVGGLGISIHDIQDDVPLISTIDSVGNLKRAGIVFLKRYFIETKVGESKYILPFKTFKDMAPKIVFGNRIRLNEYDILLALSGLAWDTMATNKIVYNIINSLYMATLIRIKKNKLPPLDVYMQTYTATDDQIRKARKIAIPIEDFFRFPSQKEMIVKHIYDPAVHNYRKIPESKGCVWNDEIAGEYYANKYPNN